MSEPEGMNTPADVSSGATAPTPAPTPAPAPAEVTASGPAEKNPSDPQATTGQEDETRRRFKEALDRKKAAGGTHIGPHAEGKSHLKGSSDNRQRQFRRKSG